MCGLTTNAHGFDFEVGRWTSTVSRLAVPLSGSDEWLHYRGTTIVYPLWAGAYAVELDVSGHAGRLRAFSLRMFDDSSDEWLLRTGVPGSADLDPPLRGGFADGIGEFVGPDSYRGTSVLVRFVIRDITQTSARFEQYFSTDGGESFELNLFTEDVRA
jgi:hypothetical protein